MCIHDATRSPQEIQKAGSSRKGEQGAAEKPSSESNNSSVPLFLQYPVPYTQDAPTPLLVSQSPSKLQFGNPYSMSDSKGRFPPQKVTPTICSAFSGSICRIQMMDFCLNPVCADDGDEEFSDDQLLKLPPVGPPSWDSNVVCIQPTRNHSRPEGHEESEEKQNNNNNVSPRSEISLSSDVQYKVKHLSFF